METFDFLCSVYSNIIMRCQKRGVSNQRKYGQNANWVSGLKQHASLRWNFKKRCPVNDSTPLAHSCTASRYCIAHEQFFARGLCEKLIMARWWQRYTAKNQRIRVGANWNWCHRFCMVIALLCTNFGAFWSMRPRSTLLLLRKPVVAPLTNDTTLCRYHFV